jgi:hypothetical protein
MEFTGTGRIFGLRRTQLFTLPKDKAEVGGDSTAEIINAGLRIIVGTTHRQDYVYHPIVSLGCFQVLEL